MTDTVHHPFFGSIKSDYQVPLFSMAQHLLEAFSLSAVGWQKRAEDVLSQLGSGIDTAGSTEFSRTDTPAGIKVTEAPVAAFLCKKVSAVKCKTDDPVHLKNCEEIGEKLSACILVAALIRFGDNVEVDKMREALDSARSLKERHPDLLVRLTQSIGGDVEDLHKKLSELSKDSGLTPPQQRLFNRMAALLLKAMKVDLTNKCTDNVNEPSELAEEHKSQSEIPGGEIIRIHTSLIDPTPFPHRLEDASNLPEIIALSNSMQEDGQDIPITVRPHPEQSGRYQAVSGSRRLMAAMALDEAYINATVKDLDDNELVMAQGRDNSYRRDPTYIERVRLAGHIFKFISNYDQAKKQVGKALSIDETEVSRLKVISEKIPNDIIESIGPAPKIGRKRWQDLADLLAHSAHLKTARHIIQDTSFEDLVSSDERFLHLAKAIEAKPARPKPTILMSGNTTLGKLAPKANHSDIQLPDHAFAEFVADKVPRPLRGVQNPAGMAQ